MRRASDRLLCVLALALAPLAAQAQSFRQIVPIFAPDPQAREAIRLRGAASSGLKQIPREVVEEAVRRIYTAYNTPEFRQYLSERFYDPERLLDAVNEKVPREARLRLISVNSAQTVSQQQVKDEQGKLVSESLVLVVAKAQLEFTTAAGFQRREGESELVLRFREAPR